MPNAIILGAAVLLGAAGRPAPDAWATLVVTFERGFEPDTVRAAKGLLRHGKARIVPGRGGKVLDVGRYQLGAAYSPEVLDRTQGTVEFWFASRRDPAIKGKEHGAYVLWSAESRNQTGLSSWISWNHRLIFRTAAGYKNLTRLEDSRRVLDDGKWRHLAYTWDKHGLALYIDGRLHLVSRGAMRPPPHTGRALFVGYGPGDQRLGSFEPVAKPSLILAPYSAKVGPPDSIFCLVRSFWPVINVHEESVNSP